MSYLFIAGAPRSGTSMTCAVLAAHGVDFGGPLAHPDTANPRGYWEHLVMRTQVIKPWLRRLGADDMGQWPLLDRDWAPAEEDVAAFRRDVRDALGAARAHKDAKTLVMWRMFHAAFPNARWLVVRRDPEAIARSAMRTPFMCRFTTEGGWLEWAGYMEDRIGDLIEATHAVEVWPDATEPESFRKPIGLLGIRFDQEKTEGALDPSIWGRR